MSTRRSTESDNGGLANPIQRKSLKKDFFRPVSIKTAGIIGGLGPETTAEFYMNIVNKAKRFGLRPPVIIDSVPMPLEDEKKTIFSIRGGTERLFELVVSAAKRLEAAGVDFLAIPCNTAHIFIDEVRSSVSIPILSIVDETASAIENQGLTKVGILATQGTVQSGIHRKKLSAKRISLIEPTQKEQHAISEIIVRILEGKHSDTDKEALLNIASGMDKKGAQGIILGCTDLQLLVKQRDCKTRLFDTMELLANAVAREIFG